MLKFLAYLRTLIAKLSEGFLPSTSYQELQMTGEQYGEVFVMPYDGYVCFSTKGENRPFNASIQVEQQKIYSSTIRNPEGSNTRISVYAPVKKGNLFTIFVPTVTGEACQLRIVKSQFSSLHSS